jgi:polar amino acid transport system permease protein
VTAPGTGTATTDRPADELVTVPVRHPGRWVSAIVIAVLAAMMVHSFVANPKWDWHTVGSYLFDHTILVGLLHTLELTVLAMAIGIFGGILLAVMRLSKNPIVAGASWLYIWFFRGTPVLVQLVFWYYLGAIYPKLSLGIPFGPSFVHGESKTIITQFTAAILGLGLNEAAYMAEIVRAGILSVDPGQQEAAHALGMRGTTVMRRIVLPQAMRVIIPPTGNETISMLKTTSLVYVIAYGELFQNATLIYSRTYQTTQLLLVVSLWYLFCTSVLTGGQFYVERYYARGSSRALPETPIQKLRRVLFTTRRQPPAPTGPGDPPVSFQRNAGGFR